MGKPGQRYPHAPIIDKRELKTPTRRMVEGSITAMLWAMWMYWILPVVTVVLWTVGIKMFYRSLLEKEQFLQLHLVLKNGGLMLLAIFFTNLIWINYNYYFIFRRLGTRRKGSRQCEDREFAAFYSIDEKILTQAKQHNRFEITLADKKITITSAVTTKK